MLTFVKGQCTVHIDISCGAINNILWCKTVKIISGHTFPQQLFHFYTQIRQYIDEIFF